MLDQKLWGWKYVDADDANSRAAARKPVPEETAALAKGSDYPGDIRSENGTLLAAAAEAGSA